MKLAIGTAQFGLDYGIANQIGIVNKKEIKKIISIAKLNNINTIDTAISYGKSEQRLGENDLENFNIVTKLPKINKDIKDIEYYILKKIENSLNKLNITSLKAVLLHRPNQLLSQNGKIIWKTMEKLKKMGITDSIGFSIYDPEELSNLFNLFRPDIIQTPYNIFDQRIVLSGWFEKLHNNGVKIDVRSIFLQGLLLIEESKRPDKFKTWHQLWHRWDNWLDENSLSPLDACINFVNNEKRINRVVIGIDSSEQLRSILNVKIKKKISYPNFILNDNKMILNPSNWSNL